MTEPLDELALYQQQFSNFIFRQDPEPHRAFGWEQTSNQQFDVYRRMARDRIAACIEDALPRFVQLTGNLWDNLLTRYFDQNPPRSRYLRELPGEFVDFLTGLADLKLALPGWALDLARYEWALLNTAYRPPTPELCELPEPFAMDQVATLTPAHQLLRLQWPVHTLESDTELEPCPVSLCLYRNPDTHDVFAMELSPMAEVLLIELAKGDQHLVDVLRLVAANLGLTIDVDFLNTFSDIASDLWERGVWIGSQPTSP